MNKNTTIAFDVDGTLIYEAGDTPRYDVIQIFRSFEALGCNMIIWSGGGMDYAERWAQKLGLDATILPKASICADIAFDDYPGGDGKLGKKVICVGNSINKIKVDS